MGDDPIFIPFIKRNLTIRKLALLRHLGKITNTV